MIISLPATPGAKTPVAAPGRRERDEIAGAR